MADDKATMVKQLDETIEAHWEYYQAWRRERFPNARPLPAEKAERKQ